MAALAFPVVTKEEAKLEPYPYVYVENDGSYRELAEDERDYLQENFHQADGARPYVKFRYRSKTPDGKLGGYCKRSKLPKGLVAGVTPSMRKWWKLW